MADAPAHSVYGTVYRARQIRDGKTFAIKSTRSRGSSAEQAINEASILRNCSHRAIIHLHHAVFHDNVIYQVITYIDAGSLFVIRCDLDRSLMALQRAPHRKAGQIPQVIGFTPAPTCHLQTDSIRPCLSKDWPYCAP